jgi:hypothetical protein
MKKMPDEKTVISINDAFRDTWKETRDRVLELLVPYSELVALLTEAECPVRPEAISLSREKVIATARPSQMIRNKYGILDLSWGMGNYEKVLAKIENSEVYFR